MRNQKANEDVTFGANERITEQENGYLIQTVSVCYFSTYGIVLAAIIYVLCILGVSFFIKARKYSINREF